MRTALYIALGIFGAAFTWFWIVAVLSDRTEREKPTWLDLGIGLVVNFFDALGIGSFATSTSCFKLWNLVPDENIPGTLNVGVTLPAVLEAFLYMAVVDVDPVTLTSMISAAVAGSSVAARPGEPISRAPTATAPDAHADSHEIFFMLMTPLLPGIIPLRT